MNAFTGSVVAPLMASGLVVLAFAAPATSLEFDRERVAAGEGWRLVTGQLVHWSAPMMAADLGVLLVSAAVIEHYSRRLLIGSLVVSAAAVAAGVHFLETDLTRYRGGSGLAAAVVVMASLVLSQRPGTSRVLAAAVLGTLAVKLIYELATGPHASGYYASRNPDRSVGASGRRSQRDGHLAVPLDTSPRPAPEPLSPVRSSASIPDLATPRAAPVGVQADDLARRRDADRLARGTALQPLRDLISLHIRLRIAGTIGGDDRVRDNVVTRRL